MSATHLLIVLLVILILFGSKKIPEFMQGIGKGLKEFKKATSDIQDELNKPVDGKQEEKKPDNKN